MSQVWSALSAALRQLRRTREAVDLDAQRLELWTHWSRKRPDNPFVRDGTLDKLSISRVADEIHIEASARSFLHHQVRSMVGSLVHVGEGKWSADDLAAALAARDRTACGQVAPPHGLYLVRVDY